jgi:hypothetical protein
MAKATVVTNNNGNAGGSGQEIDCAPDWDGLPILPSSSSAMATRVAGK